MHLSYKGKGTASSVPTRRKVSLAPSTFEFDVHAPDSVKDALVSALASAKGHASAAEILQESDLFASGNQLKLQTTLSKNMLPVIFNADCQALIESALRELDLNAEIKILSNEKLVQPEVTGAGQLLDESAPFAKLRKTASDLNSISDKLSKQVQLIDGALKGLNLGVSTWIEVGKSSDEQGYEYLDEIGYAKFRPKWCIALRSSYSHPTGDEREESWPFADAPRQLRIEASKKIPDLLEKLSLEAEKMISVLSVQVEQVEHLTKSMIGSKRGER